MGSIISFCGIDIRRIGKSLHCSALVGKDKSFIAKVSIDLIKGVYYRPFDSRRHDDKPYVAIRAVKACGVGYDIHRFYIPTYISVGESECEGFVSEIKKMIGMEESD